MIPAFQFSPGDWVKLSNDIETGSLSNDPVKLFVHVKINAIDLKLPYDIAAKWGLLGDCIAIPGDVIPGVDSESICFCSSRRVIEKWSCKHIDKLETSGENVPVHQESIPVGNRGKKWTSWKISMDPDSDDDGVYD